MPDACQIGLRNRGICVIIPTYNNAGTIVDVVTRTQAYCADVFVVLDGCTDDTLSRLEAMPQKPRCIVLEKNAGKGSALKAGFRHAKEAGFAYAITLDGDGQHYPEDIPLFLEANRRHPGALIIGKRQGLEKAVRSKGSKFANAFSNFWFFVQTWIPLADTQTGYRLYPLHRLPCLPLMPSRYEAELALLVFSAWRGVPLVNQEVRVYYPSAEERVSHFRPLRDFGRISVLNVILCTLALVYGWPVTILRGLFRFLKTWVILLSYLLAMALVVMPCVFLYLRCGGLSEKKKDTLHLWIYRIIKMATSFLGFFGNPFTVSGRTEEDFSRPAVIICNHQSQLDLLAVLSLTPKLVILTADWVQHNPLYGFIIRAADFLPASKGLDTIAPRLQELVDKGYSIVVFPESTRSVDGRIGRFHQGAFYLAERFDIDILPVVLYGTRRALPKHGRIIRSWPILRVVDPRISPQELTQYGDSFKAQASSLRKYFISRSGEIADQIEQKPV
ncbi:MAG: 1-acyl-sn-glycerol-3-phosphate acyltransferase [Bacteroidales bacterium]|nr:1-acyl-sn-glycerol-3-phosphate acyltransferase [Bacteroidales bacterium]